MECSQNMHSEDITITFLEREDDACGVEKLWNTVIEGTEEKETQPKRGEDSGDPENRNSCKEFIDRNRQVGETTKLKVGRYPRSGPLRRNLEVTIGAR